MLKLDPVCEDAQFELVRVRVQILIDMGFTPSLSEQAVRTYSTVQQALEALLTGKSKLFLFFNSSWKVDLLSILKGTGN